MPWPMLEPWLVGPMVLQPGGGVRKSSEPSSQMMCASRRSPIMAPAGLRKITLFSSMGSVLAKMNCTPGGALVDDEAPAAEELNDDDDENSIDNDADDDDAPGPDDDATFELNDAVDDVAVNDEEPGDAESA